MLQLYWGQGGLRSSGCGGCFGQKNVAPQTEKKLTSAVREARHNGGQLRASISSNQTWFHWKIFVQNQNTAYFCIIPDTKGYDPEQFM